MSLPIVLVMIYIGHLIGITNAYRYFWNVHVFTGEMAIVRITNDDEQSTLWTGADNDTTLVIHYVNDRSDVCDFLHDRLDEMCTVTESQCLLPSDQTSLTRLRAVQRYATLFSECNTLRTLLFSCDRLNIPSASPRPLDDEYRPSRADRIVGYCLFGVGGVLLIVSIVGLIRESLNRNKAVDSKSIAMSYMVTDNERALFFLSPTFAQKKNGK